MLLYLHIPFCDSKCFYCSFNSYVDKIDLKEQYVEALIEQFKKEVEKFDLKNGEIETMFIGGGTPSTLSLDLYEKIFKKITPYFQKDIEITIEANPNSTDVEWLKGVKNLGVNRVSFGVQSFNDEKLKYLGRNHSGKIALAAVEAAYAAEYENISLDLIHDTKIDNIQILQDDLTLASKLPINHISSYSLSIEKGTKFHKIKERSKDDIKEQNLFYQKIEELGFPRYEVSNFGRYKCKHNLGYWSHKEYLGIGSGAIGFLKGKRLYPHKNIEKYIKDPCFLDIEEITSYELKEEALFLGLRSIVGFDKNILSGHEKEKLKILIDEKLLYERDGKIYNNNFMLSDEIVLFILS